MTGAVVKVSKRILKGLKGSEGDSSQEMRASMPAVSPSLQVLSSTRLYIVHLSQVGISVYLKSLLEDTSCSSLRSLARRQVKPTEYWALCP